MQLEMFETPDVGIYVAPKPKPSTALESLDLRPLLEKFALFGPLVPLLKSTWTWTEGEQRWSAVINIRMMVATHGHNTGAEQLEEIVGADRLRGYVESHKPPANASRITFALLREWAEPAVWPDKCPKCGGDGFHQCECGNLSECQNCDENLGLAKCQTCNESGTTIEMRPKNLEKTAVDSNLLACALETLAPAVAPGQNLWMWRDENGGRPMLRFESRDWRLIVMARTTEAKEAI